MNDGDAQPMDNPQPERPVDNTNERALTPEVAPKTDTNDPNRLPIDRAVIHAAAVLQTLAENQRALRESVDRAERTELLLQNVSGLNDTFRAIATTQARLLDSIEVSDRRREAAEHRARRSGIWTTVLAAGFVALIGGIVYIAAESNNSGGGQREIVLAAIQADVENQREERKQELQSLALSFRDAISDRKTYEDRIAGLASREAELQTNLENNKNANTAAGSELELTKKDLAEVRAKLNEYQMRAIDEGEGINRVMSMLNEKGLSVEALRESLKKQHAESASQPAPSPDEIVKIDPVAAAVASSPKLTPIPGPEVNEVNALLAYASATDLRLVDVAGRTGGEMHDAYFTRYNNAGKPSGFIVAKKAHFGEFPEEPRLALFLFEGYELSGKTKIPFAQKSIEFHAVDPSEWHRRLPNLLTGVAVSHPSIINITETAPSASPADPGAMAATLGVRDRINAILSRHVDYLRLQIEEISQIDAEALTGITLHTFVLERDAREPRLDQTIRARVAHLTYFEAQQRLEIELEEGTRGREKPIPFLGGKLTLLIPGVAATELAGEPPLPIRRR
ncbi:MAG: hypothetical protein HY286_08715 [Planctomycetes bacterium]|nr:hypothetical protein [Planctomycetota bacterium]